MVIEAEQILLAQQGDVGAWETLVLTHQQAVFSLAYLLLGDPDDAEDVAQETFIRAYHALGRFDTGRPLRPWLLRIAANLARNQRRAIGRYIASLKRLILAEPQAVAASARNGNWPNRDDAQMLWQAVRQMKPADQEIIYLRYFLDMPEAEMAAALGVAPGTVKSRLHRALERLRAVIANGYPSLWEDKTV